MNTCIGTFAFTMGLLTATSLGVGANTPMPMIPLILTPASMVRRPGPAFSGRRRSRMSTRQSPRS